MAFLIGIIVFILWVWAIIDIVKSKFPGNNQIVWLLVVILLPALGTLLYVFIGRDQRV